jgi:parallel beta-helix repeat protein
MNRKIISEIVSILLLTGMFAFSIPSAKAITTIYIRADGSIDPPTAPIATVDNVTYTLSGDIYISGSFNDGVVVERDNIVLDGAGFSLQGGALSTGLNLTSRNNVTIRNVSIEGFRVGLNLVSSFNNRIVENNFTANDIGVLFDSSSNNTAVGNIVTANAVGTGFVLFHSNYNNIVGNVMVRNDVGVYLDLSSSYNSIIGNTIMTSEATGIELLSNANYNSIVGNNITGNKYVGIQFFQSDYNSIVENSMSWNWEDIEFAWSSNNRFWHNNLSTTRLVRYVFGDSMNFWDDGYPSGGNYWSEYTGVDTNKDGIGDTPLFIATYNQDNYPLMHPYGSICNLNTSLTYLTIQSAIDAPETLSGHTIFVGSGTYCENLHIYKPISLIGENKNTTVIDANRHGDVIYVEGANHVRISGFTLRNTSESQLFHEGLSGVSLWWANDSVIINNIITNGFTGIEQYGSHNNTIQDNIISNNLGSGIYFANSTRNLISSNVMANNAISDFWHAGIFLISGSDENMVENNTILSSTTGIGLEYSNDNIFFHNEFINNTVQTYSMDSENVWDDGYPSGGNYWSDYAGVDLDHDGIGDSPYIIDANNQDNYPLMKPYAGPHDIGIISVSVSKTVIAQGCNPDIRFEVINYGVDVETIIVNAYANSTRIFGSVVDDWPSRNPIVSMFEWLTSGLASGNYTISVYAAPVPGETDATDNTKSILVKVTIPGDVNGDFSVNIADVGQITANWLRNVPPAPANADINGDGIINTADVGLIAVNWQKHV